MSGRVYLVLIIPPVLGIADISKAYKTVIKHSLASPMAEPTHVSGKCFYVFFNKWSAFRVFLQFLTLPRPFFPATWYACFQVFKESVQELNANSFVLACFQFACTAHLLPYWKMRNIKMKKRTWKDSSCSALCKHSTSRIQNTVDRKNDLLAFRKK